LWSFFLGHHRELAVIASEAKQSILSLRGAMDCVVAALLAMTAVNAGAGAFAYVHTASTLLPSGSIGNAAK